MATNKLFTVAGTSSIAGQFKARFATDPARVKVLVRTGHENITLVELDRPMLKMDAVLFLKDLPEFQSAEQQAAFADFIEKNTPRERKPRAKKEAAVEKAPKAKAKVESKPAVAVDKNGKALSMSKDAIRKREARAKAAAAKAAAAENEPY